MCAQHAQPMRRTGGGPAEKLPPLTPSDQRLIAVMGGLQFATGDSHVAVNPFSSTSQSHNIQLDILIPSPDNKVGNELESHGSPVHNVETVRVTSPLRELRSRRTSLTPRERIRSRTVLDQDCAKFAEIESRRVEAEVTTARALSQLVEQVESISTAIRDGSQTVANGLNSIADALKQNRQ